MHPEPVRPGWPVRLGILVLAATFAISAAAAVERPEPRTTIVISDLHMGLGRTGDGWHASEDFRWPKALAAFLDSVSEEGKKRVDLLIAGDFLELWQPPEGVDCSGPPARRRARTAAARGGGEPPCSSRAPGAAADYGCTVQQVRAIAEAVSTAHRDELEALARFATVGSNRVVVIPGNHDAALVLDPVWEVVERAFVAPGARAEPRVERARGGVWLSADGRLLAEHGHQIGFDANKYPDWPEVSRRFGVRTYVRQPWGERFVQCIFNREEASYPLIDNLSPSSAGARYRLAEGGFDAAAADVAKFLRFNLADTSLRQKIQILGENDEAQEPPRWDLDAARALGAELFAAALEPEDPFAVALRSEAGNWPAVRARLDAEVRALPDAELESLCDLVAIRQGETSCEQPVLGTLFGRMLLSRERQVKRHLARRPPEHSGVDTFVYGHTHSFELPWPSRLDAVDVITVANSGAFQRLIDDDRLSALAKERGLSPAALLRQGSLDELPPCYTFVQIDPGAEPELRAWYMPEDAAAGRFVDPCGPLCPNLGHGCDD